MLSLLHNYLIYQPSQCEMPTRESWFWFFVLAILVLLLLAVTRLLSTNTTCWATLQSNQQTAAPATCSTDYNSFLFTLGSSIMFGIEQVLL